MKFWESIKALFNNVTAKRNLKKSEKKLKKADARVKKLMAQTKEDVRSKLQIADIKVKKAEDKINIYHREKKAELHKELEAAKHKAKCELQDIYFEAATRSKMLTVEMYKKDIFSRPFFRLAPLIDKEGYKDLQAGTGGMLCKLIYPDGSRHPVKLIPYDSE